MTRPNRGLTYKVRELKFETYRRKRVLVANKVDEITGLGESDYS